MTIEKLKEYAGTKKSIQETKLRIERLKLKIRNLNVNGTVTDCKVIHKDDCIIITKGNDYPREIDLFETELKYFKEELEELLNLEKEVFSYIKKIRDKKKRLAFKYRYVYEMSQQDIATRLGVDQTTISLWTNRI